MRIRVEKFVIFDVLAIASRTSRFLMKYICPILVQNAELFRKYCKNAFSKTANSSTLLLIFRKFCNTWRQRNKNHEKFGVRVVDHFNINL